MKMAGLRSRVEEVIFAIVFVDAVDVVVDPADMSWIFSVVSFIELVSSFSMASSASRIFIR